MNPKQLLLRATGSGINLLSLFSARRAGELAFRLFATPPRPNVREKEASFLATAVRRDQDFEGKRLAVYEWLPALPVQSPDRLRSAGLPSSQVTDEQQSPYVLLAYGWGYNAGRWRYFVPPLLAAGYRVIAYDPPGHGYSAPGIAEYPMMVRIQKELIGRFGRAALFLGHSFGGGCLVGTLAELPPTLRPERVCLMGVFSEARWIFHNFRRALGINRRTYLEMTRMIYAISGRRLSSYDNARLGSQLGNVPLLLIHDPQEQVVAFSNAVRNHQYWPGSYLYRATGAGHHLSTPEVTQVVMDWLIDARAPTEDTTVSQGIPQATHELHQYFIPLEQDLLHGRMRSVYYG